MSNLQCSFCGLTQILVDGLFASSSRPGVYICNECVDLFRAVRDDSRPGVPGTTVPVSASEALARSNTPRISVQIAERYARILVAERRLVNKLGREPTAEEIAAASGIEPDEQESIKRSIAELGLP